MVVTQPPPTFGINVKDYGAKGDGSTDDTAAFQAAINAARGSKLYIPQPSSFYKITDTLTIQPISGDQVFLDIEMLGVNGALRFNASNKPIFRSYGWKHSVISGVKVQIDNAAKNVIAWEIDADVSRASTSVVTWRHCLVDCGTGGNGVGWRFGATGGDRDFSVLKFDTCQVNGQAASYGDIGWQNMSTNGLGWVFVNCGWTYLHTAFTDTGIAVLTDGAIDATQTTIPFRTSEADYPFAPLASAGIAQLQSERILYTGKSGTAITGCTRGYDGTTGATHGDGQVIGQYVGSNRPSGGSNHTFINCVGSFTERDFGFSTGGRETLFGGRFEEGKKFIHQYAGSAAISIIALGIKLADYTPSDGQVIRIQHPGALTLDIEANRPANGTPAIYTAAFVTFNFSASYWLKYKLMGAVFGSNPAHTVSSGNVSYSPDAVILNSSNQPTGVFT